MKTTNSFLDKILPQFGNPRENIPIYNDSQKMFMSAHYTSAAGNMYYKGIRFTDRLVMVEKVGLYKNFSYIDSVEIYAFDGEDKILVGKYEPQKEFYDAIKIKEVARTILISYIQNSAKLVGSIINSSTVEQQAEQLLQAMYENPIRSAQGLKSVYTQLLLNE